MKEIVFVETPYIDRECERILAPFAISKIVNQLSEYIDKIEILDFPLLINKKIMTIDAAFYENIVNLILEKKPKAVIFTSTKFVNFSTTLIISEMIKTKNTNIKIIYGGHQSTLYYDYIFDKFEFVDFIVYGDNIKSTCELVKAIILNTNVSITNVLTKDNRNHTSTECIIDSDIVNVFNNYELEQRYIFENKIDLLLEVGKGCSSNCLKCTGCYYFGTYKKNGLNNIKNKILDISKLGCANSEYIYDLFLLSNQEIMDICNYIINNGISVQWYTRTLACRLDIQLVNLMREAGCCEILVSIEKYGQKKSNSFYSLQQLYSIASECQIHITFCMTIGNDIEGEEMRKIFDIVFLNIENEYMHYEFTVNTLNNMDEFKVEDIKLELSTLKGIDFIDNDSYFEKDTSIISRHPYLFINCYSSNIKLEKELFSKYSVFIMKYFRRSLNYYIRKENVEVFEVLKKLFVRTNNHAPGEKELVSYLKGMMVESNVVLFEEIIYSIIKGEERNGYIEYTTNKYLLEVEYDIKVNINTNSYYIVCKNDENVRVYKIPLIAYQEIKKNVNDISQIDKKLRNLLIKQKLL